MCTRYTIFKNWGYRGLRSQRLFGLTGSIPQCKGLGADGQRTGRRNFWAGGEDSGRGWIQQLHPGVGHAGHTPGSPGRAGSGVSMVVLPPGTAAAERQGLKRGGESWESTVGGFASAKLSETKNGREARHQEFQVASTFHFSWYFSVSTACSWLKPSSAYSANKLK